MARSGTCLVLDYLHALKQWPQSLRPLACLLIPQRSMPIEQWRRLNSHLSATLQARLLSGSRAHPPSIFDHIVGLKPDITTEELIHAQISLVVVGIHATAAGLTQLVYDLAAHSEQGRELRDEGLDVFKIQWTKSSLGELKKLDSRMKESQRMSSADLSECIVRRYGLTIQLPSSEKQRSFQAAVRHVYSPRHRTRDRYSGDPL